MYLSCLLIDVGTNPDRPRPGRLWLRNLYHVHQRLCMAFPSVARKSDDPDFLKPFTPDDFALGELKQVHVKRGEQTGFLFRIDPQPGGRVVILVQSAAEPVWDYAFHNARHFLAAAPEVKQYDPALTEGERLQFRLLANPTQRLREKSLGGNGQPVAEKWVGKRVAVPRDKLVEWLSRRAEGNGFRMDKDAAERPLTVVPGYIYVNKNHIHVKKDAATQGQRLFSAQYDGILTVTDSAQFRETLIHGIGPAKAFGFGLLSVARFKQ